MPYIGTSPSNGVRQTYDYTATAGQTSFSGSDNNSQTLAYTDSAYIDVYQNGILLVPSDYTATTGTTVVLDTGATVSDTLQIVVYDVFSVADTVSASDGGSFGGNLGVGGTLSATGALSAKGGAVFNEDSADVDFRVESNGDANMLFVDGGNGRIGIGTNSPQKLLHLKDGDIVVGNGTASNDAVIGRVGFSTDASNSRFIGIESFRGSDAANGDLRFHTFGGDGNNGERIRIFGGGNTTFSTTNQSPAEGTAVGARIGISGKVQLSSASSACLQINRSDNNGDILVFRRGGTVCGEITVNGDSQTTAYQTSSDYRLKENVTYDFDATARLKQLKPCRFNFISNPDNTTVDGFLAHEVQTIVPEAIGGEKDGTQELDNVVLNSDGTVNSSEITEKDWVVGKEDKTYADDTTWVASKTVPKYQGIDQSKLVPLLVKTIQELEARITALESK